MKLARLTILALAMLASVFVTNATQAMYHSGTGGFLQRDPGETTRPGRPFIPRAGKGYQDGMNLYVGHFASHGVMDPTSTRICIRGAEKDDIYELFQILEPNVFKLRETRNQINLGLNNANTHAGALIKELVDMGQRINVWGDRGNWNFDGANRLDVGNQNFAWAYFQDANGDITSRKFPQGKDEMAAVMGHELIHAWAEHVLGGRVLVDANEIAYFAPGEISDGEHMLQPLAEGVHQEELHAVGLTVARRVPRAGRNGQYTIQLLEFTGTYTENSIRAQLNLPIRRSYANQRGRGVDDPVYLDAGDVAGVNTVQVNR